PLIPAQPRPILVVFDQVGVETVTGGGTVAGDIAGAAVVQVSAGHAVGPGGEHPPDAHPGRPGLQLDPEQRPDLGTNPVCPDDQVVPAASAVGERDVDTVRILDDRLHGGGVAQLAAGRDGGLGEVPGQR